jgi:hypothetical protein
MDDGHQICIAWVFFRSSSFARPCFAIELPDFHKLFAELYKNGVDVKFNTTHRTICIRYKPLDDPVTTNIRFRLFFTCQHNELHQSSLRCARDVIERCTQERRLIQIDESVKQRPKQHKGETGLFY